MSRASSEFTQGMAGIAAQPCRHRPWPAHRPPPCAADGGEVTLVSVARAGGHRPGRPCDAGPSDAAARDAAAILPQLPPMRVLAAEDNATNRIILQSMLQALGVDAVIVPRRRRGARALGTEVFRRRPPRHRDAGLDGLETLDALNQLPRGADPCPRRLPVTANVMTHQVEDYLARASPPSSPSRSGSRCWAARSGMPGQPAPADPAEIAFDRVPPWPLLGHQHRSGRQGP